MNALAKRLRDRAAERRRVGWELSDAMTPGEMEAAAAEIEELSLATRPMDTAPRDGTRVIVKAVTFAWDSGTCQHVATGSRYVEAWWADGFGGDEAGWREWCGNERTLSTEGRLTTLGWIPCPDQSAAR